MMTISRSEKCSSLKASLVVWLYFTCFRTKDVSCTEAPEISPYPTAFVTESYSLTLTCNYDGTGTVSLLKWFRNAKLTQGIVTQTCKPLGSGFNATLYSYNCTSEQVFTWTILQVTEEQHGDSWYCEVLVGSDYIRGSSTIIFVNVPVQSVKFTSPPDNLITVEVKQTISFVCITSEERPRSTILWYLDGNITPLSGASVTPVNNTLRTSTTSTLRHNFTRNDNGKRVFCTAINSPDETRRSEKKQLNVQYSQDGPPLIRSYSVGIIYQMIESTEQMLYCSVSGGNPPPRLTWDCNNGTVANESARESTVNKSVTWTAKRQQGQDCICISSHPVSGNMSSRLSVDVLYPPNKPSFDINSVTRIKVAVITGRNISVRCVSLSNPDPTYRWTSTRLPKAAVSQQLSLINTDVNNTGTYTCNASNNMTATNGLIQQGSNSADVNIDVLYPPRPPKLTYSGAIASGTLYAILGEDVFVNCTSDGNPTPTCTWNGQTSMTLQLKSIQTSSHGQYSCTAINTMIPSVGDHETKTNLAEIYIDVLYPPDKPSFDINNVSVDTIAAIQGRNLSVRCIFQSNPAPTYKWTSTHLPQPIMSQKLILINTDVSKTGTYICTAENEMTGTSGLMRNGSQSAHINLDVLYTPSSPELRYLGNIISGTLHVILGDDVFVNCTSDGNPAPTCTWNGRNSATLQLMSIQTYRHGQYTCTANNTMIPSFGAEETKRNSSDIYVDVLYPPSKPSFDINGDSVTSVVVIRGRNISVGCSSQSNPAPLYTWTSTHSYPVTKSNLSLDYIGVQEAGEYTCIAENEMIASDGRERVGTHSANISLVVQYPSSSPELSYSGTVIAGTLHVILGDDVSVTCTSHGNPSPTVRWKEQTSATLQLLNIQLSSIYQYECTANNTLTPTVGDREIRTISKLLDIDVMYGPSSPNLIYNYGAESEEIISGTILKIIEGNESVVIKCSDSVGNPSPSYTWSGLKTSQNGVLQVNRVSRQDSGTYTCHAKNTLTRTVGARKTDYFNRSLEIDVLYPPVIQEMTKKEIPEGSTLNVSCLADSNPAVKYRWTTSNQTVSNNAILYIPAIQRNDSDTYTCIVEHTMEPTVGQTKTITESQQMIVSVLSQKTVEQTEKNSPIAAIIGPVIGALIAVGIVVVLVIFIRRRIRPRKFDTSFLNIKILKGKKKRETNTTQNLSELIDFKPKQEINSAFIEAEPFRAETEHSNILNEDKIQVHKLWDYLNHAFRNNGEKLQQDFQKLPSGLVYDCTEASRLENGKKNRYRDMIAYDHSRVLLERNNEKESTYINANYIDGYKRPRKFIASQGPTQAMIVDFWDMILQQKTSVIVMLTNLVENGAKKCMKYWPEEEENEIFGDITLTVSKTTTFPDYVIRELDVTKTGEMPKRVVQIHFTAWPDKAVPDTAWHLVNFWRKAATMSGTATGPILVHCSAGVGRTGTYIALDNLYTQAKTEGYIEPFEIVNRMREQRVNMVQTKDQYIFLHEALAEALYLGMKPLKPSEFAATFSSLLQPDKATGKTGLEDQFKWINESAYDDDDVDHQYGNLLPTKESDEYRPKRAIADAVNGVEIFYIQNYTQKDIFLVTKSPGEQTVDELHMVIAKKNIRTVINLSAGMESKNTVDNHTHLPGNDSEERGSCCKLLETKAGETFDENIFSVKRDSGDATRTIKEFVFHSWKEDTVVPSDTKSVIALLNAVQSWQPFVYEAQPILIHCKSGFEKSGLVCVLLAEFERIRIEEEANILETVKRIKDRNPRMIQYYEQYKFCYLAVLDYIRQFDVYMNV